MSGRAAGPPPDRDPGGLARRLLRWLIAAGVRLTMRLEVTGREHVPATGPYLAIGNHFSWFEVVVLCHLLPALPAVFAATELQRFAVIRALMRVMTVVPVWRGQMERGALARALALLAEGRVLAVFPEGGIDPAIQAAVRRGQPINITAGHRVRDPAVLIAAPNGAAYLAVHSGAPILPVAYLGTEHVLANLRRLRRTPVTVRIGPPFGPLTLPDGLRGPARRAALTELTTCLMGQIARLMPPERRGPYGADADCEGRSAP